MEIYWQLGEIAERMGQHDRAQGAFRKALEIDGHHQPSRRGLVQC